MVATFKQPDQTVDTAPEYKSNIDASINVMSAVAADFASHEAVIPDMTVLVDAGQVWDGSSFTSSAQQTTAAFVAPTVNPRIDRIAIVVSTGLIVVIAGTEAASPVAPSHSSGQYPVCQIALAVSQTSIVNNNITDERPLVNLPPPTPAVAPVATWTSPVKIGTAFALVGGRPAICKVTETDFAFIDDTNDALGMYRWNGDSWTLVGSTFSLTAGYSFYSITGLTSTTIAITFNDGTQPNIRTYSFNGTVWSLVGNTKLILDDVTSSVSAISSTEICYVARGGLGDSISTYSWDGTDWTRTNKTTISIGNPKSTYMGSSQVAVYDKDLGEIRMYYWNATSWSLVGSALVVNSGAIGALTSLNASDISFCDATDDILYTYRFDGSVWSRIGSGLSITEISPTVDLAAINGTDVAFVSDTADQIRVYRHGFSL